MPNDSHDETYGGRYVPVKVRIKACEEQVITVLFEKYEWDYRHVRSIRQTAIERGIGACIDYEMIEESNANHD